MVKVSYKTVAEVIGKSPQYTRQIFTRHGISFSDLRGVVDIIQKYRDKNARLYRDESGAVRREISFAVARMLFDKVVMRELFDSFKVNNPQCWECGSTKNLHIHHVDFDHFNNELKNLSRLCGACHFKVHNASIKHSSENKVQLLTVNIAAQIAQRSTAAIYNSIKCGKLKAYYYKDAKTLVSHDELFELYKITALNEE